MSTDSDGTTNSDAAVRPDAAPGPDAAAKPDATARAGATAEPGATAATEAEAATKSESPMEPGGVVEPEGAVEPESAVEPEGAVEPGTTVDSGAAAGDATPRSGAAPKAEATNAEAPDGGTTNAETTNAGATSAGATSAGATSAGATASAGSEPGAPAGQEPPADGAPRPGRTRRRRWRRVLVAAVVVLVVLAGGVVGGAWALDRRYESKVTHEDLLGPAAAPRAVTQSHFASGPLNLLLLGSDSRVGETDKGTVSGQRSDTIMLVHISAQRDKATVISIPRDSYVHIPAGGSWKGGMNKLNAAFAFGGAPLAARTVTDLTGVTLDGAMVANFAGIRTMVDAVGGVNVCVPYDVKSYFSTKDWTKGCHEMDGATAEEFMRNRMYVPGGDFGRMKDQQLVVEGIIQKVSAQGVLTNPLTLDRLLSTAAQSLTIDKTLNLRQLVLSVKDIKPSAVTFATAPFIRDDLKTPAGSAVELDPQKCAAMFAAVRADTIDQWLAANPPQPVG